MSYTKSDLTKVTKSPPEIMTLPDANRLQQSKCFPLRVALRMTILTIVLRTTLLIIKRWLFQIDQRPQISVAVIVVVFHWRSEKWQGFKCKKRAAEGWYCSVMKAWQQLQRDHVQTSSCENTSTSLIEGQECLNWSSFKRIHFYCSRKGRYFQNVAISSNGWRLAWDQTNLFWISSLSKLEKQEQCSELNVQQK